MEEQLCLPGIEEEKDYQFQTMKLEQSKYKMFGLVTNMDWEGGELIRWHYKRCGKSEEAHSVMKEDLARGEVALWRFWGECGLVVDHGAGVEPESSDEGTGSGEKVDLQEDEGDTVFSDQSACPSDRAISATFCKACEESSFF